VFVTTEDGAALRAFRKKAKHRGWTVYTYIPALLSNNSHFSVGANGTNDQSAQSPRAEALKMAAPGWASVHSLMALLLALEARLFVVTAAGLHSSNWGRLIDELRMAFVPNSSVVRV
jgi:hypothetical protein